MWQATVSRRKHPQRCYAYFLQQERSVAVKILQFDRHFLLVVTSLLLIFLKTAAKCHNVIEADVSAVLRDKPPYRVGEIMRSKLHLRLGPSSRMALSPWHMT